MNLEIGGGQLVQPGWLNLDPHHGTPVNSPLLEGYKRRNEHGDLVAPNLCCRAEDGIPLPDDSLDEVKASHVMEHIPAGEPRVTVMNEAWRVLRPGGVFHIIVPVIGVTDPNTEQGTVTPNWRPWADPTHVSFWWWPDSFLYFVEHGWAPNAEYGIKLWAPDPRWEVGGAPWWEGKVWLVKP